MEYRGWYRSGFDVRAALWTSMTQFFANVPTHKRKKKIMNISILYQFKVTPNYLDLLTEKTIHTQNK